MRLPLADRTRSHRILRSCQMDREIKNRAETIRQQLVQLRDSL